MNAVRNRQKEEWADLACMNVGGGSAVLEESYCLAGIGRDLRRSLQMLGQMKDHLTRKEKDGEVSHLTASLNQIEGCLATLMVSLCDLSRSEAGFVRGGKKIELWPSTFQEDSLQVYAQRDTKLKTLFFVGNLTEVYEAMQKQFQQKGWSVETYPNGTAFMKAHRPGREGCLITDARMPGRSGLEIVEYLKACGDCLPTIMITDHADIRLAVRAIRSGAVGFLEQPVQCDELFDNIEQALELGRNATAVSSFHAECARRMARLTVRERQVMELVVEGNPNKQIAYVLDINQRTVETHRASVMKKIGARSLPELIHLTRAAAQPDSTGFYQ